MKIVVLQYNKDSSAIMRDNTLARAKSGRQPMENSILFNGYSDRLLWEEAASLKPKEKSDYCIPGIWQ